MLVKIKGPTADVKDMSVTTQEDNNLVSLVYVSSGSRPFQPQEVAEILRRSRANNQRLNITGMLLYKSGNFMQVLEGPEQSITDLMTSIERDGRHRGMIVLIKKPIQNREFAEWSMAFKDLNDVEVQETAGYSPFLTESLLDEEFHSKPDRCYKLLLGFKRSVR